jgi:DNA-binding LytR/AlgR family response regulator
MQILVIEDEALAAKRLMRLVESKLPQAQLHGPFDHIEAAVSALQDKNFDLVFMDIQLADGLSFEIFRQVEVSSPVIFTTAFDQYALKAFKVNSIDYLLKPIDEQELERAIKKFEHLIGSSPEHSSQDSPKAESVIPAGMIEQLLQQMSKPRYKERFLLKQGSGLDFLPSSEVAYFFSDGGVTQVVARGNRRSAIDYTLDDLETQLNPQYFYRVSRKCILHLDAIAKIHKYFNGRLKLDLVPEGPFEILVSRERVSDFRKWLGD